jgi:hypothetical protein
VTTATWSRNGSAGTGSFLFSDIICSLAICCFPHRTLPLLVRSDNGFYNPSTAHRKDSGFLNEFAPLGEGSKRLARNRVFRLASHLMRMISDFCYSLILASPRSVA